MNEQGFNSVRTLCTRMFYLNLLLFLIALSGLLFVVIQTIRENARSPHEQSFIFSLIAGSPCLLFLAANSYAFFKCKTHWQTQKTSRRLG
uniref:Uncharacterized protein n=1 Tax=Rubinisphaera brasiliensis (strain ATCC 49424 / DSM 5305 / JCM 21570 / IAM 15109 / NBRC 103401 / IFAM 1448) TaxID=756272 RepID=F0SNG1_RUBBR|nr:hypothetical protein Plabr_0165 [Rubinisphaera brasiliensis DSM 5305]